MNLGLAPYRCGHHPNHKSKRVILLVEKLSIINVLCRLLVQIKHQKCNLFDCLPFKRMSTYVLTHVTSLMHNILYNLELTIFDANGVLVSHVTPNVNLSKIWYDVNGLFYKHLASLFAY